MLNQVWRVVVSSVLIGTGSTTSANPLPSNELEQRCWLQHTRERTAVDLREPTAVSFTNLRDGQIVASPVRVEFAVRGMGVAPAGTVRDGSGHHHLLVNKRLPMIVTDKLPFDSSHRHFGKGQTSTLLDLPPGRHQLRLLFADHDHRPYFVFSREITIEVLGPRSSVPPPRIDPANFAGTCRRWYDDQMSRPRPPDERLYFANIRAEEPLVSPFNLHLGVQGFGVCASGANRPAGGEKTGHFVVDVFNGGDGRALQNHPLTGGATQLNVFIAPGKYRLRLRFVDDGGSDLLPPHELPVTVTTQSKI